MTKLPKSKLFNFPMEHDIKITDINYEDITPECKEYLQIERDADIAGDEALSSEEAKNTPSWTPKVLKAKSALEIQVAKDSEFKTLVDYEPTELSYPSKKKVFMNYFFAFLGMLAEGVTYYSVSYYSLNYHLWESVLVAGAAVAFTKMLSWGINKYIKDWIKTSNAFKNNLQKIIFVCLALCILANGIFFVIPRAKQLQDNKKFIKIELLNDEIAEIEKGKENLDLIPPIEKEIAQLEKSISEEDGILMKIAKFLAMSLLCILTICCSAILFSIASFHDDVYAIKREMDLLKEKINLERARVDEYPKVAQLFTRMKRVQIRSRGKFNYFQLRISKKYNT